MLDKDEIHDLFIYTLDMAGLWDEFISEYGEKYEAKNWASDGWTFEAGGFHLRECGLYPDHRDNSSYWWGRYKIEEDIRKALEEHFYVEYNGGDEEDGLVIFKKA